MRLEPPIEVGSSQRDVGNDSPAVAARAVHLEVELSATPRPARGENHIGTSADLDGIPRKIQAIEELWKTYIESGANYISVLRVHLFVLAVFLVF